MCGIAGVIAWDDRYRVDRPTLARMSARIAHRGPDGEGFYLNHEQEVTPERPQCGFAFRRLAILDPDPRAMQPFTIGDKTIVFNREIYTFRELRAELTKLRPDYQWRTTGDTEVLLLAYDQWQDDCVDRLNGMFAFAVWDERDKSLFLARDRMGQKPLFLASYPGVRAGSPLPALAFASELGPVCTGRPFNRRALTNYLRYGFCADLTFYENVDEVPTATCLKFKLNRLEPTYYFPRRVCPAGRPAGSVVTATRALVVEAVRKQLVSDVPLGCFLSGGVDSSVVAACMRRFGKVQTFSIGFDDRRYDESAYAARVAEYLGTEHHEFRVRPDAVQDLPRLAEVFGQPFGDSSALPTHYLSRATRRHVKVALSGDGGDELFGGYDRYRAIALSRRLESLVPAPAAAQLGQLAGAHPKSGAARAGRFFRSLALPIARRYASYLRLFDDGLLDELGVSTSEWPDPVETHFAGLLCDSVSPVEAAAATDRALYLPNDLLTKLDRASMLHGLEVRSPFMDHELVTFAAGLTTDQLLKGGPKRMLRDAFADDLPAWVFKRKKMGFAVPIGEWFRGELRAMLRDNLFASDSFARQHFDMKVVERLVEEHETQRVDHSQRLYALLMLELWWRTAR